MPDIIMQRDALIAGEHAERDATVSVDTDTADTLVRHGIARFVGDVEAAFEAIVSEVEAVVLGVDAVAVEPESVVLGTDAAAAIVETKAAKAK